MTPKTWSMAPCEKRFFEVFKTPNSSALNAVFFVFFVCILFAEVVEY